MLDALHTLLIQSSSSLGVMFIGIVLMSYLLEDLAIVSAAVMAVQGDMPVSLALLAIFLGIATGDLGLYALGRGAKRWRWIRWRLYKMPYFQMVKRRFQHQQRLNLFVIRFIPGFRTLGFTLAGFIALPIWQFLAVVLLATSLWTGLVFGVIYWFGRQAWLDIAAYQWWFIVGSLVVLLAVNRLIKLSFLRGLQWKN
ncbi:VTT domain-containing protein [Marinomonas sp. THO17]|uniref:DedA family protein n=1 Tax=Marinomonas sp. THO17 TaxID=3149048 RepID=UPI00336C1096